MAKAKAGASSTRGRPALSPEARENQMIALATDLAEKQLREGTASSQVITHYLKLGTTREQLEKAKLEKEVAMVQAKTESLQSSKNMEELMREAISAFRTYSGHDEDNDDED
ncbi:MAG: hypothetical protein LUF78_10765 [Clostridiales bacterium]|nr:hypothetical protein [Clostridiales bacterium]